MSISKILCLFTRTPLHVGAGSSVGAIDQPIVRERHTGFPIIPASSLKGTFADAWLTEDLPCGDQGRRVRVKSKKEGGSYVIEEASNTAWLFGSDDANVSFAGAIQFSEAKLLAFPVRSAKGSFAWITSPLILRRAARDGVLPATALDQLVEPLDDKAIFETGEKAKLAIGDRVVLEEYTFAASAWGGLSGLCQALSGLLPDDSLRPEMPSRLVILSDGMMSFFGQNACEIAQHVRINDETGTAEGGALFNQENVPTETLFYSLLHFFPGRGDKFQSKSPEEACAVFADKLDGKIFQFGGDSSTGLGYCSIKLADA